MSDGTVNNAHSGVAKEEYEMRVSKCGVANKGFVKGPVTSDFKGPRGEG